jgi:hypothetical protein
MSLKLYDMDTDHLIAKEESMVVRTLSAALIFFVLVGCAAVHVKKTGKGFYNPTDPNKVEILLTPPEKPYEEVGTVTVSGYGTSGQDTIKMHDAIRAKVARLGANAVILTSQGTVVSHWTVKMWAQGVAIRYKAGGTQK